MLDFLYTGIAATHRDPLPPHHPNFSQMSVANTSRKGYTHLRTSSTEINERNNEDVHHEDEPEEHVLLRHVPDSLPLTAWLVILAELCERFTYFGLLGPLQNYIQNPKHDGLRPGGLGSIL